MLTEIGKALRKLRIDNDERLLDMAERVDKSASFISAVEVGKKSPPAGFEEIIARAYGLACDQLEALRIAANRSRHAFMIEPKTDMGRDTAALLARKIDTLTEDDLRGIQTILNHERGKPK